MVLSTISTVGHSGVGGPGPGYSADACVHALVHLPPQRASGCLEYLQVSLAFSPGPHPYRQVQPEEIC